jgi:5-carboxyvanillate decarboxylase
MTQNQARPRVIAVEEAYGSESWIREVNEVLVPAGERPDQSYMSLLMSVPAIRKGLVDLGERLRIMDETGVDVHLLSLSAPGVQMHDAARATELAAAYNDELAAMIARHPDRLTGLGTVAPQSPDQAAAEVERIMGPLGLNGVIINSHTQGHYLDEPAFEPLLAALEASDATLYLHPRIPSAQLVEVFAHYGMLAAMYGFAVEAGVHALRLILSGAFDRFPRLRVVLGHAGEALPYWTYRFDNMYTKTWGIGGPLLGMRRLELAPSEYLRRNFGVTTSGMDDPEVLAFCLDRVGEENVMFAIDYPYEDSAHAVKFLNDAPLTERRRELVSHSNAERFFRIPPAA